MEDLLDAAGNLGLDARFERLSWHDLVQFDGCAVLWVGRNHFIAVDPREGSCHKGEGKCVRVYDPLVGLIGQWWSRERLERLWAGDALLIKRRAPLTPVAGPAIAWETCWKDLGKRYGCDTATFEVEYRNTGTKPLSVEVIHTSCRCASAELSAAELQPGARGLLRAAIDLRGKRGRFVENVLVRTNDRKYPVCCITLCGIAVKDRDLLSPPKVHFGCLRAGQTLERKLFLHDPGNNVLQAVRATVENARTDVPVQSPPRCAVSLEKLGPQRAALRERTALPLLPGDYVLHLNLVIPANCTPCDWKGQLMVRTGWERRPFLTAELACRVLAHIEARPAAVVLSDRCRSREVRIVSQTGRSFAINKVVVVGGVPVAVVKPKEMRGREVRLKIRLGRGPENDAALREGSVVLRVDGGRTVDIPVVVLPGSAGRTN